MMRHLIRLINFSVLKFFSTVDSLSVISHRLQSDQLSRLGCVWFVFQVAPSIKTRMMEKGTMMVGYQPLGKLPNFFRIVLTNPSLSTEDIDFFLDETVRLGEE